MTAKCLVPTKLLSIILRIFFRLLYQPFAWSYDLVAFIVSLGMWKEWIYTVLPYISGINILELGHGPGHLLKSLSYSPGIIIGLDNSRQMSHIAYRLLKKNNLHLI